LAENQPFAEEAERLEAALPASTVSEPKMTLSCLRGIDLVAKEKLVVDGASTREGMITKASVKGRQVVAGKLKVGIRSGRSREFEGTLYQTPMKEARGHS